MHRITEDDRFVVIGSDGVFEFLTNHQVMQLVIPFYESKEPEKACQKLYSESLAAWRKKDSVVDDITALTLFL